MEKTKREILSMGSKIGGVIGAIAFLLLGLVPGFYFGSYATLIILSKLFGGPLKASAIINVIVAAGIILGIICIAAAFIVVGAIFGTAVSYLTYLISEREKGRARVKV